MLADACSQDSKQTSMYLGGHSHAPEIFRQMHCVAIGALAVQMSPSLPIDSGLIATSLESLVQAEHASSHALVHKALLTAASFWRGRSSGRAVKGCRTEDILMPYLFLL